MDGWTDTHFNLENNKKSRPKYLQTLLPPKLPPPLISQWKSIPLFAAHSSHNTLQGVHLHISRGDNVICINLMSLSKEKTLDTCRNKLTLFKGLFSPYYWQYWPWLADKALLHRLSGGLTSLTSTSVSWFPGSRSQQLGTSPSARHDC